MSLPKGRSIMPSRLMASEGSSVESSLLVTLLLQRLIWEDFSDSRKSSWRVGHLAGAYGFRLKPKLKIQSIGLIAVLFLCI